MRNDKYSKLIICYLHFRVSKRNETKFVFVFLSKTFYVKQQKNLIFFWFKLPPIVAGYFRNLFTA